MSGPGPLPTRTLSQCPACGGTSLKPLPLRYEYRGQFPLVECGMCTLRFLRVQPTHEAMAELYAPEYFERDFRCGRSEASYYDEDAFRDENRGLLDQFAKLRSQGRLLEIGCAGGWLLKHAEERGWEARGVELSSAAAAHAQRIGLEVFHGEVTDAGLPATYFDMVYMGDVLEHVTECRAVLNEVARVLKPAGFLYLRGPITTHSLARRLALWAYRATGREITLREPPYHVLEFTPRSLRGVLEAAGLTVVRMRQSKIPPGPPHGEKTPLQRALLRALDALNVALTRTLNILGDRVVVVAQKR